MTDKFRPVEWSQEAIMKPHPFSIEAISATDSPPDRIAAAAPADPPLGHIHQIITKTAMIATTYCGLIWDCVLVSFRSLGIS